MTVAADLAAAVDAAFAPEGPLARAQDGFRAREGQRAMAMAVADTVTHGGALVVEAGTGVGKTFAYLVPALLSGERVLLSTATKALQDQLFARDVPRLAAALGLPVRLALLKGRSSYLCAHRLGLARQSDLAESPAVQRALAHVERWALATVAGDLAELPGLDERSPVIPLVTSTRENCLGSSCPQWSGCHVQRARREALAAEVVVVNHHLFFADLTVRESGMAELLPTVRVVIFDEAHQLNETGVQFMGTQLSSGQLTDLASDLRDAGLSQARGWADWPGVAAALDQSVRSWRLAAGDPAGGRRSWVGDAPDGVQASTWDRALQEVVAALRGVLAALDPVAVAAPDMARQHARALTLLERADSFTARCATDAVRWLDVGANVRLVESPLDIAPTMQSLWTPPKPAAEEGAWEDDAAEAVGVEEAPGRAWIFTSATLGDDAELRWFTEPCGLAGARVLRVASPFDYAAQAAVYVPRDLPVPADPEHGTQLARWLVPAIRRLGGRTLVLTTTLKALRRIGDALTQAFAPGSGVEVLVQGAGPRRQLMERFRRGDDDGAPGCVLVASATFWEGFDVPGDALQLVVIDKLPFPPPGDPLVEARSQRLQQAGRSVFKDFALPEAAVALKQGAGRLIRHEGDAGLLVVADTRLVTMGYGKRLLKALPPMRLLQTPEAFDEALAALTRTSTTDSTWPGSHSAAEGSADTYW